MNSFIAIVAVLLVAGCSAPAPVKKAAETQVMQKCVNLRESLPSGDSGGAVCMYLDKDRILTKSTRWEANVDN